MVKEIQLTQGFVTIVDDEDYVELNKRNWRANIIRLAVYAETGSGSTRITMHRILMPDLCYEVDHKNNDSLDNRRQNLRYATPSQNIANRRRWAGNNKYRGVYKNNKGVFEVKVGYMHKIQWVGAFNNEEEAARAYDKMALKLHGEFAQLNFPC